MKKIGILLPLLLLTLSACVLTRIDTGETQEITETIERQDAREARITLEMGAGELNVSAGSANLMEGEFVFNVADWQPEIAYAVSDGVGTLNVRQPGMSGTVQIPGGANFTNRWNLAFSDALPLEMEINLGAGESRLSLGELDLRSLSLEAGAGSVTVDLGGALEDLRVEAGVGELQINLGAAGRTASLNGSIQGGVGSTTLILPTDAGVRVEIQQGLGGVNTAGFNRDGDIYTNDAYGASEVTIDLRIESGVGEVTLELAD